MDTEERFWAKVAKQPNGCWQWTAFVDGAGYGRFHTGNEQRAHRWAYQRFVGPIVEDRVIDHLCRNRSCVNPDHLRLVTSAENTHAPLSDAPAKRLREAPSCKRGHPWKPETTRWVKKRWRRCLLCARERNREARAAARSSTCPKGHPKTFDSSGRLRCMLCWGAAIRRFHCGHRKAETGVPARNGILYCAACRVTKRTKGYCKRGHAYTPENSYTYKNGRQCIACRLIRATRTAA